MYYSLHIRTNKCNFATNIRANKCIHMQRTILNQLIEWKQKDRRKPLILNGARQVGKTYILKAFGEAEYESIAYVSLDNNPEARQIFEQDYNIQRIIRALSALLHIHIEPSKTLIILDEIQESPYALNALKYFCEDAPEYHIAVAGSLLGVSLHQGTSFPVGKVDILKMYPMTFEEFLLALEEKDLVAMLQDHDYSTIDSLALRFTDYLRQYYYVGGMPAAVKEYVDTQNLISVRALQKNIIFGYRRDFSKHAPTQQIPRINLVWDSIPSQLAKDNKKFIYGALKPGGRAKEFELAIQWLIDAGLVYRIYRATSPSVPLKFYEDLTAFKLFMLDVGLMGAMADTDSADILIKNDIFEEYKGAFTELYAYTQLAPLELPIYYYSANDSRVEIDFLAQYQGHVIPIEVKAEENVRSKSLKTYIDKHPTLHGLRLSMLPYRAESWMTNRPLYAPSCWLIA